MKHLTEKEKEKLKRKLREEQANRLQRVSYSTPGHSDIAGATEDAVRKNVRSGGIASIVWGLIWIALGAVGDNNPILLVGGAFLMLEGLICTSRQQPALLVLDGLTLAGIGILNIASVFIAAEATAGSRFWMYLGVTQILWGGGRMRSYWRWKHSLESATNNRANNKER
jgi:hypothetical protein